MRVVFLTVGLVLGLGAIARAADGPSLQERSEAEVELFTWLPEAPIGLPLQVERQFQPSGSVWNGALDERQVFAARLMAPGANWSLGIGRGGQVYSLRGPFGEAVPPQRPGVSEWNDEVWQTVAVASRWQSLAEESGYRYFLHGSGAYPRDPRCPKGFANPLVAAQHDRARGSYAEMHWAQQAHVPTPFRSELCFLSRWTAVDVHTVEWIQAIHNWGGETCDFFNLPWGGVRASSFPIRLVAMADGSFREQAGLFATPKEGLPLPETAGWLLFAAGETPTAPALALVMGRGNDLWPGALQLWRGGHAGSPQNDRARKRDYAVSSVILKGDLPPFHSLWARVFFVIGDRATVERRAAELASQARICRLAWDAATAPRLPNGRYAVPVPGSTPVWSITPPHGGKPVIDRDPYRFASSEALANPLPPEHPAHRRFEGMRILRPYDPPGTAWNLLGFEAGKEP
jgi:hypothetical protein